MQEQIFTIDFQRSVIYLTKFSNTESVQHFFPIEIVSQVRKRSEEGGK